MTLFGGMSKGERTRIQIRTRSAMMDLAARSDRFLGGRPPDSYHLADAGRIPTPVAQPPDSGPTASNQTRSARAPFVEFFTMYTEGHGLRESRATADGRRRPVA
jgi:site-specific DNA recombinase